MIVKPLVIDQTALEWDTLELLDDIRAKFQAGETPSIRDLKCLIAGLFVGWTLADAGKITNGEAAQIFDAIGEQLGVPKSSATASSAPLTTAD